MSHENEDIIATAIDAGQKLAAADYRITYVGKGDNVVPVVTHDGDRRIVLARDVLDALDQRASAPRRLQGTSEHHELDSFIEHIGRFKADHSVVWADRKSVRIMAIYDYASNGDPRWAGHRAAYTCPLAPEWVAWVGKEGEGMTQDAFANFIEEHQHDIVGGDKNGPTAMDMLELARNLQIHIKGEFRKVIDPTTGTGALVVREEHGEQSTKIPKSFRLALRVFEGGVQYAVEARIRFTLQNGRAFFGYVLHRREETVRDAFNEVIAKVRSSTGLPVYMGRPE